MVLLNRVCFILMILASKAALGAIFVHAGPEIYYFKRTKSGGTHQSGVLEGGRITIERLEPDRIYAGVDAFWAGGDIDGFSASGRKLFSFISDFIIEGRFGYTVLSGNEKENFFTLYGGYGYFREINSFQNPSPIRYTTSDTFNYASIGFLSGNNFNPMLSIGINFEIKFMLNGQSKISDDPIYDDATLKMTEEIQARIEVPFSYRFPLYSSLFHCSWNGCGEIQLVPFYEYRHFGGREDFPFDFIDTQFNLVGIRAAIGICF